VLVVKGTASSHAVTAVGYDLTGTPDTITIADPWTPATAMCGNNSHKNDTAAAGYDTLAISSASPLKVMYDCGGTTAATELTVAVLIFIAPETTVTGPSPTPSPTPTPTVPPGATATPTPTPTPTPPPGDSQNPFYSVFPDGPSLCDPADILAEPGTAGAPCGAGGPDVCIPCAALTRPVSCAAGGGAGPPANDDVSALSFAAEPPGDSFFFSVDTDAAGCPGTGVAGEASTGHPDGDEFLSEPVADADDCSGENALLFPGLALGFTEGAAGEPPNDDDDLDALSWPGDGQPYFTLAAGSPTLAALPADPSDILTTPALGDGPEVAIDNALLGLLPADAIDGICIFGEPALSTVWFSLAPGSPSLAAGSFSPGDVLIAGPVLAVTTGQIGLLETDNLDAMKCMQEGTLDPSAGDVDCSGGPPTVDDALKVLLYVASLAVEQAEPCPKIGSSAFVPAAVSGLPDAFGDVDCSGSVTAGDALGILRAVAALPSPSAPPGCPPLGS
jgi:hypothetical protein